MIEHISAVTIFKELWIVLITGRPWKWMWTYAYDRKEFSGANDCGGLNFHRHTLN
jgi:hypothetical protein